jgi:hypothetical protein
LTYWQKSLYLRHKPTEAERGNRQKPSPLETTTTKGKEMIKTTKCNWCGAEWEYDETIDICLTCNQMDYLMDTKEDTPK